MFDHSSAIKLTSVQHFFFLIGEKLSKKGVFEFPAITILYKELENYSETKIEKKGWV